MGGIRPEVSMDERRREGTHTSRLTLTRSEEPAEKPPRPVQPAGLDQQLAPFGRNAQAFDGAQADVDRAELTQRFGLPQDEGLRRSQQFVAVNH